MNDLRIPADPEGTDRPHDVLAAEEFAMPARGDFGLHLPRDPHGIEEPYDVLAADEFAMPSGPDRANGGVTGGSASNPLLILGAAALALLLYAAMRRPRRAR